MGTEKENKEQPQKDQQPAVNSKQQEEEPLDDLFSLDSDLEMEGLVDSINIKEQTMKKK